MHDMQPNCLGIQVWEVQTQDIVRLKSMGSLTVMYCLYEQIHILLNAAISSSQYFSHWSSSSFNNVHHLVRPTDGAGAFNPAY